MLLDRHSGRLHAISALTPAARSRSMIELTSILNNLRTSADQHHGDYRLGILDIVELMEANVNGNEH